MNSRDRENSSTPHIHVDNIEDLIGADMRVVPPPAEPPPRGSWMARGKSILKATTACAAALSLRFAAVDDPELAAKLKPFERNFFVLRGGLQGLDFCTKAMGLIFLFEWASGSGVSADIVVAAVVVAAFLVTADHVTFVRASLIETGIQVLFDARLKVMLPSLNRRSVRRAKALRVAVTCLAGVLLAFVIGIKFDHAAIVQQREKDWLANNQANYSQAVRDFGRTEQGLEDQRKHAMAQLKKRLSARHREETEAELARIESAIQKLDAGRAQFVGGYVKSQPDSIPKDDSVIGDVEAFVEVVRANPLAALPVLGLDVLALALDLMTAMLSMVYIPSAYAAETVRRQLEAVTKTARDAATNLKPLGQRAPASDDGDDDPPSPPASPAAAAPPPRQPPQDPDVVTDGAEVSPKRGRGRPLGSKSKSPAAKSNGVAPKEPGHE